MEESIIRILPKLKIFKYVVFFLSWMFVLNSQEIGFNFSYSERLEFSTDMREYFSEELILPGQPVPFWQPAEEIASKVKVNIQFCKDGGWRLCFVFPKTVSYKECIDGEGLCIAFNQEIDAPDLIKVHEKLGFLLKKLSNGFNTLYFVANRPLLYGAAALHNTFYLDIIPDYRLAMKGTKQIQIARTRLLVEERRYNPAFCSIYNILEEYPYNDKDALILLAANESLLPRWQEALHVLQYLHQKYPCDHDIWELLRDTYCPHSSFLEADEWVKRTKDFAAEHYYWLRGEQIIHSTFCNYLYLGGAYGCDRGHISSVVNDQGEGEGFLGTRSQGRVYLRNEWSNGSSGTVNFYATEGVVFGIGGEASILFPYIQGSVGLIADWHRPYWEIFETLSNFGREDRLKFRLNSVFNNYFSWDFEGGVHRVGIRGLPNGFTSLLASGNINLNIFLPNPIFALNYNLDAEYVTHETKKVGSITGIEFFPVPLDSREFHTLRALFIYQWRKYWFFHLMGGGTFNRLGTNDVTYGAGIRYYKPCPCGWEVDVSANHYPSATVQNADVDYITIAVKVRF